MRAQWPRVRRYNKIRMFNWGAPANAEFEYWIRSSIDNPTIIVFAGLRGPVAQNHIIIYFRFVIHLGLLCKLHYE